MSAIKVARFEWNLSYNELFVDIPRLKKMRKSDIVEFKGVKYQLMLRPGQIYSNSSTFFALYFCVNDYGEHDKSKVQARIWMEDDKTRMISLSKSKD
jgi:hypothetical protein